MRNNISNNNMESFYEDNNTPQFVPSSNQAPTRNGLKRPATLELNPGKSRKARFNASVTAPPVLTSPDLQVLKLVSPELEKIIINNAALPTPTPSSILYPTKATTEQEQFAKGFDEALLSMHEKDNINKMIINNNNNNNNSNNNNNNTTAANTNSTTSVAAAAAAASTVATVTTSSHNTMSGGDITYTDLDNYPGVIKEEPQIVPQSPPVSPIDMENQERIKLERKRLRNRVAASKCRKRKLERISKLEDKVKELKSQNTELCSIVFNLKQHVIQLKQQVIEHHNSGCTITLTGKF
ncbi:transcription factor Jra [Toxorhynchites rutilus septentrionalis]|uniref:transcription factor Jra n=1 Tax=Toxorhynchites rutilus septentrionalis TaxID=329112 RepID=UPI002478E270|nr:transcription factor Jra [Toxorhynchites rutilus septentrionalis]